MTFVSRKHVKRIGGSLWTDLLAAQGVAFRPMAAVADTCGQTRKSLFALLINIDAIALPLAWTYLTASQTCLIMLSSKWGKQYTLHAEHEEDR